MTLRRSESSPAQTLARITHEDRLRTASREGEGDPVLVLPWVDFNGGLLHRRCCGTFGAGQADADGCRFADRQDAIPTRKGRAVTVPEMVTGPEILTQRLRLSQLLDGDALAFCGYRSDPEVCRYQSFEPGSLDDAKKFISGLRSVPFETPGSWFQFGIRMRESGLLIGDIGVHFMADDSRQVEIGFTVAPRYQGQGFGTEAVSGVLEHLLGVLRKHRVVASVDPRNKPSIALLKRVAMREEAHFRKSLWFKGEWVDDVVYGILRSEWVSD